MGTTVSVVTNEVGFYQVPYLIPGTYQVTAELQGFKKAAREVEVRIADRLEVDLALAVGETVESVTVTADTPLLETTNASLGNVVDSRRIAQLPTPHGDPVRAHRPRRRRHLHRVGPARSAVRADAHRRLLDGRHARQPQRPDDRRRAEHRDRERGRGHRLVRAAGGHRAGVQGPDRDVRRRDGQHRGRRHEPDDQVGHQPAARHGLHRQDAEGALRQRLLRQRQQHPAGGLRLQPLWRHGRRADGAARLRRPRARPSSCTASRASTSRGRATTARRRCRPRRCATATSRSCSRSDRSIRSTTRSRAGRLPAAASSRIRSPATSSRRT